MKRIMKGNGILQLPAALLTACSLLGLAGTLPAQTQTATTGSIVQITCASQGLVPPDVLPPFGTYWLVTPGGPNGCLWAPLPAPPVTPSQIFQVASGQFIVDGTVGEVVSEQTLQAQATAVVNLINQIQASQATRPMAMATAMDSPGVPFPGGGGEDAGGSDYPSGITAYSFDTNQLWLEITNVSNGFAFENLHNATNQVYAIWATTNLLIPFSAWQVATEVRPTDTNCMPFTVPTLNQTMLFLRAEDWTGVTENGNTTPDWWFWLYFGTTALSDTNLDTDGNSLLSDYESGTDPNIISFSISVTNDYVNNMSVPVQLNIMSGAPNYFTVSVDDTNYAADANWQPCAGASLAVNLGPTEGWHDVWIGLRGLPANATQTWQHQRLKLLLAPPPLVITGPNSTNVNEPVVQITGYSPEALSVISYDLTNSAGVVQNQQVWILDQQYDPNNLEFTTNTFQAFDVALANGLNVIQLHATDLAGNMATTNLSITLNYSNKPAPVVQLNWPQNGVPICGANFACSGWISDPTATVAVQLVDTNGNTTAINATVGRDGNFWAEGLPLIGGTNVLTLTVTDVVSNTVTTNLAVLQGSVGLGIDSVSAGQATVTGEIVSINYTVWVNGSQATNNGDGIWTTQITPVGNGSGIVEAIAIPNSDNGGNGSGGSPDFAGNPRSAQAQGVQVVLGASQGVYIYSYQKNDEEDYFIPPYTNSAGYVYPSHVYSDINFTHWDDGKGGNGQWIFHDDSGVKWTYTWPASSFPQPVPSGTGVETYLDYPDIPPYTTVVNPPRLAKEHCSINVGKSPFMPTNMQCTADAKIKLATGGPAGSTKMNLWVLTPSATKYDFPWSIPGGDTWWHCLTGTSIRAQNISINGQTAGADGNIYLLLADNTTPDITPTIVNDNPKNYTFDVSPQEYIPTHTTVCTAIGNPDNTRTTIGIREAVVFGGMPANTVWSLSGGKYITETNGSGTEYIAPGSPTTATVTATCGTASISTTLSVIAPSSMVPVAYTNLLLGDQDDAGTMMGESTEFTDIIGPETVSFSNVNFRELQSANTNIMWPNGTNAIVHYLMTTNGFQVGCDNTWHDDVRFPLVPTSCLFNGTTYVNFSFGSDWHDQYQDDDGNWNNFTPVSATWNFQGSNKKCQVTYMGMQGDWQGPFDDPNQ